MCIVETRLVSNSFEPNNSHNDPCGHFKLTSESYNTVLILSDFTRSELYFGYILHLTIFENIFYVMSLIVLLIIYNGFGLWNKYPAKFFIVQKSVISLVAHIQLLLDILEHVEYKCGIKS